MNYFSRIREDGKFDVLEGTPDEPGRIVTCFDTMEDAAAYIAEQSAIFDELFDRITDIELGDIDTPAEEVIAAAEEAILQLPKNGDIVDATCPENQGRYLNVSTAEISSDDEGVVLDGFVVSASTSASDEGSNSLTSSVPIAELSYLRVGDSVTRFDAIPVKARGIENSFGNSDLIVKEPGRTTTSLPSNSPSESDSTTTPMGTPIEMDSQESGGKISNQSSSSSNTDAPSVTAASSSYQVQVPHGMLTSTIVMTPTESEDGSARPATEDSVPSSINNTFLNGQSLIFKLPATSSTTVPADALKLGGNLVLAAASLLPPREFFQNPGFNKLERFVTITADGRFATHLASWDTCHVGYGEMCVTAPREKDYNEFAVGTVLVNDGTLVPTGVIALKGGHADVGLDAGAARAHYDNPDSAVVDVVVGTDEFGIWISGALRPGVTDEQIQALRASGVSGDWRLIDGQLRLIGICSVNVPGFPKIAMAASVDGITALVAAGGPPEPHPDLCGCKDSTTGILEELDYLHKIVADAGLEDAAIEKLAARILTDDDIDTLYERIVAT